MKLSVGAALVARARQLTHRQVHQAVDRLRADPETTVEAALESRAESARETDPLAFEVQVSRVSDLCRQLVRLLKNLRYRLSYAQRRQLRATLGDLRLALDAFEAEAP